MSWWRADGTTCACDLTAGHLLSCPWSRNPAPSKEPPCQVCDERPAATGSTVCGQCWAPTPSAETATAVREWEITASALQRCRNDFAAERQRANEAEAREGTAKFALGLERARADFNLAQLTKANAALAGMAEQVERLEKALRQIAGTPAGQRGTAGHDEWFRMVNIAGDALKERRPNCYGEGCPWCLAHDSTRMVESSEPKK